MTVSEIITAVDNFAWGPILIIFSLDCGMLFPIALRFPQIRLFKQMLDRVCWSLGQFHHNMVSCFGSLWTAISGKPCMPCSVI